MHSQMWRYEGHRTLSYYLKRRDCIVALSEDMGVDQSAVVATIFKQVLESIAVSDLSQFCRMCRSALGCLALSCPALLALSTSSCPALPHPTLFQSVLPWFLFLTF